MYDISIIICSYKHDKWIERCLRSVLNQKLVAKNSFEIILVDDCSKDKTQNIIKQYKHFPNLKIIKNKKNLGLPKSINLAMKKSSGRYLMRVDSDDYIQRYSLFMMKFFLDYNRHYQAVNCDYIKVNENEEILKRYNVRNNYIACGVMFRRECLFDLGLYDENFKMREGHDLLKRFLKKYKLGHLEIPLYKYRDHKTNRTKNKVSVKKYEKILRLKR
ncbi:glycosyltransferase family 2 protein [Candidatus Pelagibacter sp.]|jgi:glycosyltransferase involved in cell wall biosynthesis|nr:glycosyltransferase family 2 protein [Candidatus Pelagibacter sp.]MDC1248235.1 glycosyltransferase family 2 protein [Pelagibacteraceae bacterium]